MKVSELIEALQKMPQDKQVYLGNHDDPDYCHDVLVVEESPCYENGEPPTPIDSFDTFSEEEKAEYTGDRLVTIWFMEPR